MASKIRVTVNRSVVNEVYRDFLEDWHRTLIFYGGGGSGKSYFVAQRYVLKMLTAPMCNVLALRKVARDNRNSTFALIRQVIGAWGLERLFTVRKSDLRITCKNGNEMAFAGLDDVEKLKSYTFVRGELTDVWVEEASQTTRDDYNQLQIRMRGGKVKKQMTLTFNPVDVNHWLKTVFFDEGRRNTRILHTTYRDNAFLQAEDRELLESYRDTDPYYYDVYCLGMWGVYGRTVFDAHRINARLASLPPPKRTGYFLYELDGADRIARYEWVDDPAGPVALFAEPERLVPYVLGGDTAGEGSDFFTAQVIDNTTGSQVARLRQAYDEDIYAKQIYCLGMYYNRALVGVEVNYSTYPVMELSRLGYPKQYLREREDTITHRLEEREGFKTTKNSRPRVLAELVREVRERPENICDRDTLLEMLTFVRSEKGRPEAQGGAHDDLVMALAIAHGIRDQQSRTAGIEPPKERKKLIDELRKKSAKRVG